MYSKITHSCYKIVRLQKILDHMIYFLDHVMNFDHKYTIFFIILCIINTKKF